MECLGTGGKKWDMIQLPDPDSPAIVPLNSLKWGLGFRDFIYLPKGLFRELSIIVKGILGVRL